MKSLLLGLILLLGSTLGFAQQHKQFTPYDELPSLEKYLKPTYDENMPDWGKMLYQYPVNFNEISRAFNIWEKSNMEIKNNPLSRYFKLWSLQIAPYADPNGNIELPDLAVINNEIMKAQSAASQMRKAPAAGNTSNWTFWGPKQTFWLNDAGSATAPAPCPWQANVYSFDVTEANPNVLYAGTETGFVSKTTDKGLTWNICGLSYPFGGGISSIAIHPTNPDTVYVAAGNSIHRSVNGGVNWSRTGSISANHVRIDNNNPYKLVASTGSGIYYSVARGTNWTKSVGSNYEAWDIVYKPNSSDTLYALTKNASNKFRMIQSFDGGKNFSEITNFPDSLTNGSGGLVAVTPANRNILYTIMLTSNMNNRPFIYKGTWANGAWTWSLQHTGSDAAFTSANLNNGQGYFDLVLAVSPLNENTVFAGTCSLLKSVNAGVTLTPVGGYAGSFSIHPDMQHMKMLSNGDTWVSTDGGMNLTTDNFSTQAKWKALNNGLIGSPMWGFDQGWNEDIIVGGRYHNGNTAIADFYNNKALRLGGGESPTGWILKGKSRRAAFDDLGDGYILPKTAESKPEGRYIFSKHPNMDQYGTLRSNVVTHPYYSGQLYVGSGNSIWITTDYGVTYDMLYTFPDRVRYFDMSANNPNVMYADIVNNGLYRSADGGATWVKKSAPSGVSWSGQIMFVISPYNADVLYATKGHGVWDTNNSEVYRSTNGGGSWTSWSTLNKSVKCLAIQPTNTKKDLVYAMTSSSGYSVASKVLFRKDGDAGWTDFSTNYPGGMGVQFGSIFFRDSKLRVAGGGGVWESPLAEPQFSPVLVPWVDKKQYLCTLDTVYFDDHSFLNHTGANWSWEVTPAPAFISNANIRNPKAVFSTPGKYTVKMTVTVGDSIYTTTVPDMFEIKSCPSVDDCSNPAEISKTGWKVLYVDSYQTGNEATKAIDNNTSTIWHTQWSPINKAYPHEIQLDLVKPYNISKMIYTPRTDASNGRIKKYEIYISNDKTNWGTAVKIDSLTNTSAPTIIKFPVTVGRYVRLVALSEVNGNAWASAAEIGFVGCNVQTEVNELAANPDMKAFPIPANSKITISLPFNDGLNSYTYAVYSSTGQRVVTGTPDKNASELSLDVSTYPAGYYLVTITDKNNATYRARFVKK